VGTTLDGKYRIVDLIGEGGMGTVYEAEQHSIGRHVAVKVLRPENAQKPDAIERMRHEARVVGQIGHPNICQVFDIGQLDDGTPYLVMERLRGETLAKRLELRGPVPYGEVVEIASQVLAALEAAHRKGVIHRDLKPDNIFLAERASGSVAKVLDFGISKATSLEDKPHHLTRTGMVMGTPYYMAPEQALGERNLDGRLDVWGMGVVLYEALSGRRPFVAKNYNALLVQILTAEAEPLERVAKGLPAGLAAVVHRALSKKREDRYGSARELGEALQRFRVAARPSDRGETKVAGEHVGKPLTGAPGTAVQVTSYGTEDPKMARSGPPRPGAPDRSSGGRSTVPMRPKNGLPEAPGGPSGQVGVRGTVPMKPRQGLPEAPGGPSGQVGVRGTVPMRPGQGLTEASSERASRLGAGAEAASGPLDGSSGGSLVSRGVGEGDASARGRAWVGRRMPAQTRRMDQLAPGAVPSTAPRRAGSVPPAFVETLDHWDEAPSSTSDEEEPTQVLMRQNPQGIPVVSAYEDDNEHTVVADPPSFTELDGETETGRRRP
jgi:tRNA A-37 threonylcarbamoyl transferase component Bud32